MNDAPEKKLLTPTGGLPTGNWDQSKLIPYIRRDIHDTKVAALEARLGKLLDELAPLMDALDEMEEWQDGGADEFQQAPITVGDLMAVREAME